MIDGYKVEGPGKLVKAINGGKTQLNLYNAAWWGNKLKENCMFDIEDSSVSLTGGNIFCFEEEEALSVALRLCQNGKERKIGLKSCSEELFGKDALKRSWGRIIKSFEYKI